MINKVILSIIMAMPISLLSMQQSSVKFSIKPPKLEFEKGGHQFLLEYENETAINDFVRNIENLDSSQVSEIGKEISKKISPKDPENPKYIYAELLYLIDEAYSAAEGNRRALDLIRMLVRPIFLAYPDKQSTIYMNLLGIYGLRSDDDLQS